MIRIAVDGNGGDYGLETTVVGSMMAIKKFKDLEITIFGDEDRIVTGEARLNRAGNGHGTHTEQQCGRNQSLGQRTLLSLLLKTLLHSISKAVDGTVNIQSAGIGSGNIQHGRD